MCLKPRYGYLMPLLRFAGSREHTIVPYLCCSGRKERLGCRFQAEASDSKESYLVKLPSSISDSPLLDLSGKILSKEYSVGGIICGKCIFFTGRDNLG